MKGDETMSKEFPIKNDVVSPFLFYLDDIKHLFEKIYRRLDYVRK